MKKYLLWVAAAIVAEVIIIAIATMMSLYGINMIMITALLPAGLFIAAIYYLVVKTFRGGTEEEKGRGDDAGK